MRFYQTKQLNDEEEKVERTDKDEDQYSDDDFQSPPGEQEDEVEQAKADEDGSQQYSEFKNMDEIGEERNQHKFETVRSSKNNSPLNDEVLIADNYPGDTIVENINEQDVAPLDFGGPSIFQRGISPAETRYTADIQIDEDEMVQ